MKAFLSQPPVTVESFYYWPGVPFSMALGLLWQRGRCQALGREAQPEMVLPALEKEKGHLNLYIFILFTM